jgi:hypothetical protein
MEHFENIVVGARYHVKLKDLNTWHRLLASCLKCGHSAVINPARLPWRCVQQDFLGDLEKKLRCTRCGNRKYNDVKIGRLKRD